MQATSNSLLAGSNNLRDVLVTGDESRIRMLVAALRYQQMNLEVISDNLANAHTTAFKVKRMNFQDMTSEIAGQAPVLQGAKPVGISRCFTQGELMATGGDFDLAVQGIGFFAVQLPDGSMAYTRDGSFKLNAQGSVVTSEGYLVAGGFQPVPAGTTSVHFSTSGQVTYAPANSCTTYQVQLARFINPGGLNAIGHNLYAASDSSGAPEFGTPSQNGFGDVRQNFLECSNVSVMEETANLIMAQRWQEATQQALRIAENVLQSELPAKP